MKQIKMLKFTLILDTLETNSTISRDEFKDLSNMIISFKQAFRELIYNIHPKYEETHPIESIEQRRKFWYDRDMIYTMVLCISDDCSYKEFCTHLQKIKSKYSIESPYSLVKFDYKFDS